VGLAWLTLFISGSLLADTRDIPPALEGWQAWVLDGREYVRCPYVDGGDAAQADAHVCTWPGPLEIDGSRFRQAHDEVARLCAGLVPLPGDADHWPQDVTVNSTSVPVVQRGGQPQIQLTPGEYIIAGRFRGTRCQTAISVPPSIGIVRVTVDGRRIDLPERSGQVVRLGAARVVAEANKIDVQVYRKLTDALPGLLRTRVQLQVSGEARNRRGSAAARGLSRRCSSEARCRHSIRTDGSRVQVRAGTWCSSLSRAPRRVSTKSRCRTCREVWSFEAVDRLRSSAVEGVTAIDPQANVPGEWQGLPAYRMEPGNACACHQLSRGISGQTSTRLRSSAISGGLCGA
jgi:hypothetical protein